MPKEKLERVSDWFGCLVSDEHYTLSNPLQDRCYIVTKIINKLVQMVMCAFCVKEKVCELNEIRGITRKHYDVSGQLHTCC